MLSIGHVFSKIISFLSLLFTPLTLKVCDLIGSHNYLSSCCTHNNMYFAYNIIKFGLNLIDMTNMLLMLYVHFAFGCMGWTWITMFNTLFDKIDIKTSIHDRNTPWLSNGLNDHCEGQMLSIRYMSFLNYCTPLFNPWNLAWCVIFLLKQTRSIFKGCTYICLLEVRPSLTYAITSIWIQFSSMILRRPFEKRVCCQYLLTWMDVIMRFRLQK